MVALPEVLFGAGRYLPDGFLVAFLGAVPPALLARRRVSKVAAAAEVVALFVILMLVGRPGFSSPSRKRSVVR